MAGALVAFVFSSSCFASLSAGSVNAASTQSPGENSPHPGAVVDIGSVDIFRVQGSSGRGMLAESVLRSTASSPKTERPGPQSAPSTGLPFPSPGGQKSAEPNPVTEELVDGLPVRERAFRIAMLRKQLQEQLGLTELPPIPQEPMRYLPNEIRKRLISKHPSRQYTPIYEKPDSLITEVVSYAENDTDNCPRPGFCFLFHLVKDILGQPIKSINLWMYLTPSQNINRSPVRQISIWLLSTGQGESGVVRKELATKVVSKREGWFQLELPQEKHDWASLEHRLQLTDAAVDFPFDLSSSDEQSRLAPISLARDELPILTVAVDVDAYNGKSRRRRQSSNTCGADTTTCCLYPFQVDLTELLGVLVVNPDTILASFCRGSCHGAVNFETQHAFLMRDRAANETDVDLREDMLPCCVPTSYASEQSMVIGYQNDKFVHHWVSEIAATSCGCK